MMLDEALRQGSARLGAAGIESAGADTELLAAHVLDVDRMELARRRALGATLTTAEGDRFGDLLTRRASRFPLQHLTGQAHFRRLTLAVGPGVFVPRPETETTVTAALDVLAASPRDTWPLRLVDLCAGSGAVALAVVTEAVTAGIDVRAVAVEISPDAVTWARRNVERLGSGRVELREGPVVGCCPDLDGRVDVVTANPPYIPDDAVPRDPEVRDHDPALALFGGPDGLDVVREVATAAARLCRREGRVIIEHGETQGPAVAAVLTAAGFTRAATIHDLTGRPRTTLAVRDYES